MSVGRVVSVVILLGVCLILTVPSASGQTPGEVVPTPESETTSPADEGGVGECATAGVVGGPVCAAVTGVAAEAVPAVLGGAGDAALSSVVRFVVEGAGSLLGELTGFIDESTRPELTAGWFTAAYGDMARLALLGLVPFLLLSIIQALLRQDLSQLLRSALVYLPLAAVGTAGAVVVVDLLVGVVDELSVWIGRSIGSDLAGFATGLAEDLENLGAAGGAVGGFAVLLAGVAAAFSAFVIWLELLLRQAAIYVAVLFLPLGFMALVWPATSHWLRRLVDGLIAIILSKFVIVAVMALAAGALAGGPAAEGYPAVIAGVAMLALAALAPYVLLRLIPVFEAGLSSQLEGTLRRPTAAVSPPAAGGSRLAGLVRSRTSGGGGRTIGATAVPAVTGAGVMATAGSPSGTPHPAARFGGSGPSPRPAPVEQPATGNGGRPDAMPAARRSSSGAVQPSLPGPLEQPPGVDGPDGPAGSGS